MNAIILTPEEKAEILKALDEAKDFIETHSPESDGLIQKIESATNLLQSKGE